MKLKVLDQIHVSALSADTLQPRQVVTVDPEWGERLIEQHPDKFERIVDPEEETAKPKAAPAPKNKAAPKPRNAAAPNSHNKPSAAPRNK